MPMEQEGFIPEHEQRDLDGIETLVAVICADLPLGMSRLDAVRFEGRADSLIRGFVKSAVDKARTEPRK